MDEITIIVGILGATATAAGYWLGLRRGQPPSPVAPLVVEVAETLVSPRGGHKHNWNTMLPDGLGWRCGVVVEPGIICGWVKDG